MFLHDLTKLTSYICTLQCQTFTVHKMLHGENLWNTNTIQYLWLSQLLFIQILGFIYFKHHTNYSLSWGLKAALLYSGNLPIKPVLHYKLCRQYARGMLTSIIIYRHQWLAVAAFTIWNSKHTICLLSLSLYKGYHLHSFRQHRPVGCQSMLSNLQSPWPQLYCIWHKILHLTSVLGLDWMWNM